MKAGSFCWKGISRNDIITAGEKQAPQSGICFSAVINEQTSDEIGQGAPQARVCECKRRRQEKNKRRKAAFVFLQLLTNKRPMKSDKERCKRGFVSVNDAAGGKL
ncbi:MAG: hypothetical protein HDR71_00045 [Lachnospiraceae bacterium]|nr:hypothetical protein [Lachnospiraceae bacterium]